MSSVTAFPGSITCEPEVVQSTVEALRDMLQRAERGEIIGFAGVYVMHTGRAAYWVTGRSGGYSTIGGLECMKQHLIACAEADDE